MVWSLIPNGDAGESVLMEMQDSFGVVQGGWRPGGRASAADPAAKVRPTLFTGEIDYLGKTHIFSVVRLVKWVTFRSRWFSSWPPRPRGHLAATLPRLRAGG